MTKNTLLCPFCMKPLSGICPNLSGFLMQQDRNLSESHTGTFSKY